MGGNNSKSPDRPICVKRKAVKVEVAPGTQIAWCSCGRSRKQPYCDGSHAGTAFQPFIYTAKEGETKLKLCLCKRTKEPPFCDGIHKDRNLDW